MILEAWCDGLLLAKWHPRSRVEAIQIVESENARGRAITHWFLIADSGDAYFAGNIKRSRV